MKKTNIKLITRQVAYALVGVTTMLAYFPAVASAAQITARSVTLGSSVASATTTYDFDFTVPTTGTEVDSVEIKACQEASGGCTAATGFDASSAALVGQPTGLGDGTGWTDSSTTTALRVANATNGTNPSGAATINFSGVVNPSSATTFYLQISTYASSDWTGTAIDTGTIAASTAASVTVTATVNETLSFTVTDNTVALTPTLGSGATGVGTSTMSAGTNASSGYTISYTGTTLTSGANTIDAITSNGVGSIQGTEQFGLNLMNNATPNVGADPTGGTGAAAANYNTADDFKFVSGETVAEAAAATDATTYTVSYIANITDSQAPGAYTANINYVATANF
jgi:hypothetical protein